MYRSLVVAAGFVLILTFGGCAAGRYGAYDRGRATEADSLALMTKDDVIKLSQAGVGDDVIIRMLDASGSTFRLKTIDVVELADSGVSDRVISEMMQERERSKEGERSGGYFYYSPFYGFATYPFWDPWYPSVYLGSWPWYYRPIYRHVYVPRFARSFDYHGLWGSGSSRSTGRHR